MVLRPTRLFFTSKPALFTPVSGITSYRGLGDLVSALLTNASRLPCIQRVVNSDFVPMYVSVLHHQEQHLHVSVTWAESLLSVVTRMHQFAQQIEGSNWFLLRMKTWTLQKRAMEFRHQLKVLAIALTFHRLK
ncbi:hypothetical protein Gpo141_00010845 [Globisporangium polare]